MISRCPNCGWELSKPIVSGIKLCSHCRVFFETTKNNYLLSAAWELHKNPNLCFDQFQFYTQLDSIDAEFVYQQVCDQGLSHDEFLVLLNKIQQPHTAA